MYFSFRGSTELFVDRSEARICDKFIKYWINGRPKYISSTFSYLFSYPCNNFNFRIGIPSTNRLVKQTVYVSKKDLVDIGSFVV